jgi:hypothetical protein
MFKRIIVAFSLLLMFDLTYSQGSKNKQLVSVTLDIVGKGAPAICANADTSDYYFVTVNVLNMQDTTITFYIMDCSWPMDAFVIKSDSIAFRFCFSGCDNNIPERISLPKTKSVQFYGTIKSWKKSSSIARIKVGFRYFPTFNDIWNSDGSQGRRNLNKIVWSNEVELKDYLYSYEIK